VILACLVVHVARRNVVDIVVFGVVALLIVVEPRVRAASRPTPGWLDRPWLAVTPAIALGSVVFATGRSAPVVQLLLAIVGVVALVLVLLAGPGGPPQVATPRWSWWAAVLLAGCLLELADFLSQPDAQTDNLAHPTLSTVVEPLLADPLPRALVAAGWLLLGWWLVRLATRRGTPVQRGSHARPGLEREESS
jgi:hypothetical protein